MNVLIIDDSEQALILAQARLKGENLNTATALSGEQGLATAREFHPDLILLDIDMPGMSGFDTLRRLQQEDDLRRVPVIFLSGSHEIEDVVKGLDLGAVDYVAKPFNPYELRARVRAALRAKRWQDMLAAEANIDPLTGLANRRAFDRRLQEEWARLQRHGGTLSLILCDIDHFKAVNDTFGHRIGDLVLEHVATTLRDNHREYEIAVRFGGEEFAVVCPAQAASGACVLAERLRRRIQEAPTPTDKGTIPVTMSFGVADSAGRASPTALVEAADAALYSAKAGGRNQVQVADPSKPVSAVAGVS